ncbi:MAG TPA: hypothetical protein ENK06_14185 [Gammaproteobacteria bacterium]|nr:hypothetical protein [Gammaproteobacteria bacterium]
MRLKLALLFFMLFLQSCATYAPASKEARSKIMTPQKGMALVYVIRPKRNKNKILELPLTFEYNATKIGSLSAGQYLYFNAKPMELIFNGSQGEVTRVRLQAGQTYYLQHESQGGIGANFVGNKLLPITTALDKSTGAALVKRYRLAGRFRPVTLDGDKIIASKPALKHKKKKNNDFLKLLMGNTRKTRKGPGDKLSYNDESRMGSVTVARGSKKRRKAIKMIEELCSTKNIALKVGSARHKKGATYTTMDESLNDGKLTIKFSCAY